jgi:ABC-2 type transport system ATP-binding protein
MLLVKNLSKRYGERTALKDVNFELRRGQFCALLGPNGAGKSTLFQLLTGLFVPDQGNITIDGIALQQAPAKALARIGVVFQQQALDLDLSVRRNLKFHADLHGLSRAVALERISSDCDAMGLTTDLDRPTRELSGGTRRKVELVRALLHRPGLLLMDEATVGLDPKSRKDMVSAVQRDVQQRGTCVLWATHWVEETVDAAKVLVLHQGQLVAEGSPEQVTQALGHPTLEAGFIARTSRAAATPSSAIHQPIL